MPLYWRQRQLRTTDANRFKSAPKVRWSFATARTTENASPLKTPAPRCVRVAIIAVTTDYTVGDSDTPFALIRRFKPRFSAVPRIFFAGERLRLSCGMWRNVIRFDCGSIRTVPSRSLRYGFLWFSAVVEPPNSA